MEEFEKSTFQEEESSLKLVDIWHLFWDFKWWYAVCVAFCLFCALFYIYRSPKVYTRTSKVIIDEGAQEAARIDLTKFTGGMSGLRYATNVDNEVEALSSPDLLEEVSRRLSLQTSYYENQFLRTVELSDNSPIRLQLAGDNPSTPFSFVLSRKSDNSFVLKSFRLAIDKEGEFDEVQVKGCLSDTLQTPVGRIVIVPGTDLSNWKNDIRIAWHDAKSTAKAYSAKLEVSISSKQTSVVVLTIKDLFPKRAENVLDCLVDVYNESWVMNRNKSARVTTSFINDRLVVIEQELGQIEESLKSYKEDNKLSDLHALSNAYISESGEYAARAFEVNNQLAIVNYVSEYLNNPANANALIPANTGISNTGIETQIQNYNETILRRDRMLQTTTESNPLVVDLNQALASLRTGVLRSIDNFKLALNIEADKVAEQEKLILSRIAASSGQELELVSIERQRKVKETLYVFLLQKREENELTRLMNVTNTRLIMSPNGPSYPVSPNKMMILLMALALGFGMPFALFFLRRTLKNCVESKTDIVNAISLPYLADIPVTGKRSRINFLNPRPKDSDKRPMLVKAESRDSLNEAFRVFRTNVDLMLNTKSGCKTIMSTSLYPGSGKTFISINLAASMAIKGARTLMLDLDLRKASMSCSFSSSATGAAAYLNSSVSDLNTCIAEVAPNLFLMRVGSIPPNPSELLLSDNFPKMMEELKKQFDYIFIDCPPVEIVADASIIAPFADLTAFVIRAGLMDKRNLPLVEDLNRTKRYGRLAVVLNGVESHSVYSYGRYGYYGRHNYGYYGNK